MTRIRRLVRRWWDLLDSAELDDAHRGGVPT